MSSHLQTAFLLLALGASICTRDFDLTVRGFAQAASSLVPIPKSDPLSVEGQSSLSAVIDGATLLEMRWPDFKDYREDVARFYDAYGDGLPWVRDMQPTSQARAAVALLLKADEEGLSADDYDGPRWTERFSKLKPELQHPKESDAIKFDVALTVSMMRYLSDLHIGKVNPQHPDFEIDIGDKKYRLPEFMKEQVVEGSDVTSIASRVEPPYPSYRRTIQALRTYRQLAQQDTYEVLPPISRVVASGNLYQGGPRLFHFLQLIGDLPSGAVAPTDSTIYQGALVDAVKSFQRRHGLTPDGQIDANTLDALNISLDRRVRQMQLTLERWRWLPSDYGHSAVVVNIPEFRLRAYDEQFHIGVTMNAVVGQAYGHHTPVFANKIRYVIFRPSWNVPPSIAREEILPAIQRDPDYMAKEDLETVDSRGNVNAPANITPEILQQIQSGALSIRQRPGPKNSLGLVKFMFPNEFDVYMHDTPITELFSRSRRDFSHGCIRLEKPAELAEWVLRDNPDWTPERIRAAMDGEQTQEVALTHPIPVLIVYGTVVVLEDQIVHFYDDIYGLDGDLDRILDKGYPYGR
ncbi:MAG: L,D-transpeptidase family protein [Candidatus Acidiferrum sp.]